MIQLVNIAYINIYHYIKVIKLAWTIKPLCLPTKPVVLKSILIFDVFLGVMIYPNSSMPLLPLQLANCTSSPLYFALILPFVSYW